MTASTRDRPSDHRGRWRVPVLTAVAAVAVAACSGSATPGLSAVPSSSSSPLVSASPSISASLPTSPSPSPASPTPASPSPSPASPTLASPTPAPTAGRCTAAQLAARITGWSGAAGHRIADVELTNTGTTCLVASLERPQLVDGNGAVLIDGSAPGSTSSLTVGPGDVLTTLVQDANYCQAATPVAPVTVAFVLAGDAGRIVAAPLSPSDTQGVPPCMGDPGSAGDIEMHAWAP